MYDSLTWYFILITDRKDMETNSGQEKFIWLNAVIDDMIDIICSDKTMKNKLIFKNQKFAANASTFEKIAHLMNQRGASNDHKYRVSFSEAWNKFKKLVSACKSVSITQRTANGIARYQVEKGYRKWWGILWLFILKYTEHTELYLSSKKSKSAYTQKIKKV